MTILNVIRHSLFAIRKAKGQKRNSGFTLIELLVVIAIIGILATFVVASFSSAQQRGRDSRRKADLDALKKALHLVKQDSPGATYYPFCTGAVASCSLALTTPTINGIYIRQVPTDPKSATGYTYFPGILSTGVNCTTANTCTDYRLVATLENLNDASITLSHTRCADNYGFVWTAPPAVGANYVVCSD